MDALDQLVRETETDELRAALGAGGGELTRLLPDLGARIDDLPPAVEADPDTERHRLHTAVAELLAGVTGPRPVLLVLEDVHWADAPTLLLLRHLARVGSARALLLATFRDTEADMPLAVSELLADLRRYDVVRLGVAGLSDDEVAEFVRRTGGAEPGTEHAELASAIRDLTDGNAFLVCELWRALVETGAVELDGGRDPRDAPAGRARQPRERARGGERPAVAPRARHHRPARAGGHRGRRVLVRRRAGRRRHGGAGAAGGARRGGAQRDDRGGPRRSRTGLALHARAGAAGAV